MARDRRRALMAWYIGGSMMAGLYPLLPHLLQRLPLGPSLAEWAVAAAITASRPLGYLGSALPLLGRVEVAGPRPIILVHGYGMSRSCFQLLALRLSRVGLGPMHGFEYWTVDPIQETAARLAAYIEAVRAARGSDQVDLIGHSMGGLVSRYLVTCAGGAERVANLVTIGSPHSGTALARGGRVEQLSPRSPVLAEMTAARGPWPTAMTAIASRCDCIAPPERAGFEGAELVVYDDLGHLGMLASRRVAAEIARRLNS